MDNWNKLSIKDKANYIKLGVSDGIRDLNTIRDTYNNVYADGGYALSLEDVGFLQYGYGGNLFDDGGPEDLLWNERNNSIGGNYYAVAHGYTPVKASDWYNGDTEINDKARWDTYKAKDSNDYIWITQDGQPYKNKDGDVVYVDNPRDYGYNDDIINGTSNLNEVSITHNLTQEQRDNLRNKGLLAEVSEEVQPTEFEYNKGDSRYLLNKYDQSMPLYINNTINELARPISIPYGMFKRLFTIGSPELVDMRNSEMLRVLPNTTGQYEIFGNDFVEDNSNNIRLARDFYNTSDTLIGDRSIPLSKISTFYGIEDGKLKVGPLHTFNPNTVVVPNRAKNYGLITRVIPPSGDFSKHFDAWREAEDSLAADELGLHRLFNDGSKPYNRKVAHEKMKELYIAASFGNIFTGNRNPLLEAKIQKARYKYWDEGKNFADSVAPYTPFSLVNDRGEIIDDPNLNGPKLLFSDENGNTVFINALNKFNQEQYDKLNSILSKTPLRPIMIDNGRYSNYGSDSYNSYTSGDFFRDPKTMFVFGTKSR